MKFTGNFLKAFEKKFQLKTGGFLRIFQADFELLLLLIIEQKLFSNILRKFFVDFMYTSKVSGRTSEFISLRQ